jgi:DNA-binding NarL/FixJ family response regulator
MSSATQQRAGPVCGSGLRVDPVAVTDRELAVLGLMADGMIAAAIARRLGISPRTVSKHIENIYRKLGAHDRTTAVLRSQAMGFLPAAPR